MIRTLTLLHAQRSHRRGIAATEFALMLPILITLIVGSIDITRLLLIHQKVERVAYSVADIVAQAQSITISELDQITLAAPEIMNPMTFGADGVVIVSSVYKDPATHKTTTRWRYVGGGTLDRDSQLGDVNKDATLPNGLTLADKDNVIVTEVYYVFDPVFLNGLLEDGDLYKTAIFKTRLGILTTPPS